MDCWLARACRLTPYSGTEYLADAECSADALVYADPPYLTQTRTGLTRSR
jgi:site-specific DNA-adenine methylase